MIQLDINHMYCPQGHYYQLTLEELIESNNKCRRCGEGLSQIPSREKNISPSFVSDFHRCERYSFYSNELLLRDASREKTAMDAGSIWHAGMHAWNINRFLPYEERKDRAAEAMVNLAKSFPVFPATENEDGIRSLQHILKTFLLYITHYMKDGRKGADDVNTHFLPGGDPKEFPHGTPLAEIPFSILVDPHPESEEGIDENPPVLRGIIDDIIEFKGQYYIRDFKTTGMLNRATTEQYRTSIQMTVYIHAARELLKDIIPIRGAIIDIVGWFKNIVPEKHFIRMITTRTPQQCQNTMQQMRRLVRRLEENRRSGEWDQNDGSCAKFNSVCPFMDPCLSWGTKTHKQLLQGKYVVDVGYLKKKEEERLRGIVDIDADSE